jgi:hypothetical protein
MATEFNTVWATAGTPSSFTANAPALTVVNTDSDDRTAFITLTATGTVNGFPLPAGQTVTIPIAKQTTFYFWLDSEDPGAQTLLRLFTDDGND